MNIREALSQVFSKAVTKRFVGKKHFITTYVSLFIIMALLMTATFSWFTVKDSATIDGSTFTLSASSGLRVNQGDDISGQVKLATDVKLAEASSVDGRNIYFPTTGTFTNTTSQMTFREGNVGDKNKLYYYNDFSLNTTESGTTDVYVKGYEVKVTTASGTPYTYDGSEDQEASVKCPIRIAFIKDSADSSSIKVIDPTALLKEYSTTYKSVSSTNTIGSPAISDSPSTSFMQYYYGNEPLFTLGDSGDLNMTMVIWLEGGDTSEGTNNCDKFAGATVNLNIQLESNWDYMEKIKFIDDTVGDDDTIGAPNPSHSHWVSNDENNKPGVCIVSVSYKEPSTGQWKFVEMTKSENYDTDYTWSAWIPQDVTDYITFNRYNPKKQVVWNSWYTEPNVNSKFPGQKRTDLQESRVLTRNDGTRIRSRVYTAIQGNGEGIEERYNSYPSYGFWDYTGHDDAEILGGGTEDTTAPSTVADTTAAPIEATTVAGTTAEPSGTYTIIVDFLGQSTVEDKYTDGYKFYVLLNDATQVEMTYGGYGKMTAEVTANSGTQIIGFRAKNGTDVTNYYLTDNYTIDNNNNRTFMLNDDGTTASRQN